MKPAHVALAAFAIAVVATGAWVLRPVVETAPIAPTGRGAAIVAVTLPDLSEPAQIGERAFVAFCAECHGTNAAGREGIAPPLVHDIYEPSHHGDLAFQMAAENGVRSHHWRFGDMPPVAGITGADIRAIVTYIREVQRANGIE